MKGYFILLMSLCVSVLKVLAGTIQIPCLGKKLNLDTPFETFSLAGPAGRHQ